MKTDIKTLQDLFKISYETFEKSRVEESEVVDMYHNRHYTDRELSIFERRGQPAETFNIIKLFARLLVGYYSTVVNTVKISPMQEEDTPTAKILHDVVQYTFENNRFETEGDKVKLDGMLSGLMCVYEDVIDTGKRDKFNRPIRRIKLSHVPSKEILIDPMSKKEDYSDARYIHRFKWVSEDYLFDFLRKEHSETKAKAIIEKLEAYENHTNQHDTEFNLYYQDRFVGLYKQYDSYLLIHTIVEDDKGKTWSVFWCGEEIVSKKEITYREVKFPYRIQKIHTSDKAEYYGIFREIVECQKSINQALIKIQLMANSQKAFVQEGAVRDLDEFADAFNRVNSVIEVKKLNGILINDLNREVLEQYAIIDKAYNRAQRVLGINDSFLGMTHASDSGRKVRLQQDATTLALRYVTTKIEQFYRLLGWDIVNLIKQFYTSNETLRIADNAVGQRWVEINKPMEIWDGSFNENNQPNMEIPYEEVLDPENGEPLVDEEGNIIIAPIATSETEIMFKDYDLSIDTVAYDMQDKENQLIINHILNGGIGQTLLQLNPAGYLKIASLSVKDIRSKYSLTIAKILDDTAENYHNQQKSQEQAMQQQLEEQSSQQAEQPQEPSMVERFGQQLTGMNNAS